MGLFVVMVAKPNNIKWPCVIWMVRVGMFFAALWNGADGPRNQVALANCVCNNVTGTLLQFVSFPVFFLSLLSRNLAFFRGKVFAIQGATVIWICPVLHS